MTFSRPGAFDTLAQSFIELSPRLANTFNTLVIDEGQDFEHAWAQSLILMAPAGREYSGLKIRSNLSTSVPPVELPDWVTLASPVDYRSPQLLVEFINWLGLTEKPVEAGSAVRGFDPKWLVYDDESLVTTTAEAVANLIEEGYAPASIAVLSFRGAGGQPTCRRRRTGTPRRTCCAPPCWIRCRGK